MSGAAHVASPAPHPRRVSDAGVPTAGSVSTASTAGLHERLAEAAVLLGTVWPPCAGMAAAMRQAVHCAVLICDDEMPRGWGPA